MQTTTTTEQTSGPNVAQRRVFSGVQPTGDPQLGNYLGAFKGWVDRQDEKENFFCVVDMHAITVDHDPAELVRQTRELAAVLFACGINPEKSTLFVQSQVSAHAEACWILNCFTPLGWLERMTQFKDKSAGRGSVSTGLLDYPVLMAGDILLYSAHEVPVGDDQKQHVELARDIAQRFNNIFGDIFVVPEPVIQEVGARVMGLNDPVAKMSKSYSHIRGHAVRILDDPKEIQRSIMRAVTDSGNEIRFSNDPEKAGVNNLLEIYRVITGKSEGDVETDFTDARGYGDLKKRVAEAVIEELAPIRNRYNELIDDITELDRLLAVGADHARSISEPKLEEMKRAVGFALPDRTRSSTR
ncbi:MAG: tryptophan--tRNA ligase [SAR202 cluster bacterium]|jgi:tryptophanyl-tRNA synthetase|nr:tryptophan--tRNA ligase [SAR202 cluster bacterium]MDP6798855.1 tryptophan--tRNA ligase [SAR202 cluster bacterium]MQG59091.1 tryptophan--tRNA ligase [SAR202 cluster bacterium]MQG67734.1 tryptophan--tRNA ligase [SAR202 cluster bacterium]